jgi:hypothetical protein
VDIEGRACRTPRVVVMSGRDKGKWTCLGPVYFKLHLGFD